MEQILLKAATTATDKGIFEAVISTSAPDREKDVVDPAGMVRAIQKWVNVKNIPLAWNHSGDPDKQIGWVDPASAKAVGSQVVVTGHIDLDSEVGAHAWRLVKAGTLGFSFGYLILDASNIKGGGRNIKELDIFEITATPTPMNHDTRVLAFKSATVDADDLRKAAQETAEEFALDGIDEKALEDVQPDPEPEPEPVVEIPALAELAEKIAKLEREQNDERLPETPEVEPEYAVLHITHEEMAGLAAGDLKAVWSAAAINNLPDSAFLYVESGGDKDSDGKTVPRSLRHFPYKGPDGSVDLPHLRNALSRIPQSDLPQSVKDSLTSKAQGLLDDATKSVDETTKETKETKSRVADPLRSRADAVALEYLSDGESRRKPPREKVAPKPEPRLTPRELRQRMRDETVIHLSGVSDINE